MNLRAQIDGCVCIRFVASSRKKEAVVRDAVKQEANNKKKKAGDTSINPTGPDRWRVNYRHVVTTRFVAAATHTHTHSDADDSPIFPAFFFVLLAARRDGCTRCSCDRSVNIDIGMMRGRHRLTWPNG